MKGLRGNIMSASPAISARGGVVFGADDEREMAGKSYFTGDGGRK